MSILYFGKVSTDGDVKTLLDAYKSVGEGVLIPYADITKLIGVDADSSRYRTVTNRWRKLMLSQFNVEIRTKSSEGFFTLAPEDRVTRNIEDGLRIFRRLDKTVSRLRVVPRLSLSSDDTKRLDHATTLLARVSDEARTAKREIAPPKPHRLLVSRPVPSSAT